jgi:uncharacterized protein YukE
MTDTNTAQLVVDLRATDDAVRAKGWVAPGLGVPGAPLGLLGSTLNPLSGLAAAGLGWFMPLVSFLGEGLTQLQGGNGASVTSGARDFGDAGQDIAGVADSYRASTSAQTSSWSGAAASQYRDAGAQHADGVAGLGQASTTTGSAIIGAGQVVAQAIAEVTELIAEAVSQIVPIMTQAIARAPETFGQSVVEAIPPCVGIAVEYALRIAAKLAALVASGENLLKLVQGAMAVVDLIKQALSGISQQSIRPDAEPNPGGGAGQQGAGPASTMGAAEPGNSAADSATTGSPAPASTAGGLGGGASTPGGTSLPDGSAGPGAAPLGVAAQSTGAVQPSHGTIPDASRYPGHPGGGGASTGAAPGGAPPFGAAGPGLAGGARAGADTVRQNRRQPTAHTSTGGSDTPGGVPLGGLGGARAAGEKDKEHQRRYSVVEQHDETFEVAPPVITSER